MSSSPHKARPAPVAVFNTPPSKGLRRRDTIEAFSEWLTRCGAEVMAPHANEVLHVQTKYGAFAVIKQAGGRMVWHTKLIDMWNDFLAGKTLSLSARPTGQRSGRARRARTLLKRDGDRCWYCDHKVVLHGTIEARERPNAVATVEEVCARQHGGPNHLANQVLACLECNQAAGNKTVPEKFEMREKLRREAGRRIDHPAAQCADDPQNIGGHEDGGADVTLPLADDPRNWADFNVEAELAILGGPPAPAPLPVDKVAEVRALMSALAAVPDEHIGDIAPHQVVQASLLAKIEPPVFLEAGGLGLQPSADHQQVVRRT